MKIYLGADHRGFVLKEEIKPWLISKGHEVIDCGNSVYDKEDDFPDFAFVVADHVAAGTLKSPTFQGVYSNFPAAFGIVLCGSGGGMEIAANKIRGIRASTAITVDEVRHNRKHNNLNILVISSDSTSPEDAKKMIEAFLTIPFEPEERFIRRLKKIEERE